MNKILIAAALLAASALPAAQASAATMAMTMPMMTPTAAECTIMPMIPGCPPMAAPMKAAPAPAAKVAMAAPAMTMPAMKLAPWWPTCVAAPAGAGHLLDCTMPAAMK